MCHGKITIRERSAEGEGIAGPVLGTAADGSDVTKLAVCMSTADTVAGIDAFLIMTSGLSSWTFRVMGTLGSAGDQGISKPVLRYGKISKNIESKAQYNNIIGY